MPIDLLMTTDNDLALDGDLTIVTGAQSLAQRVKNALIMHRGDWFLDTRAGTPWASTLSRPTESGTVDALVRAEVARVQGVAKIGALSSSVAGTHYRAHIEIIGTSGEPAAVNIEV